MLACRWLVASVVALGFANGVAARDTPNVPAPPGAKEMSIGEQIRVNGVAMDVYEFVAPASFADVMAFYRALWARETPPSEITSNRLGDWQVLGRQLQGWHQTVQLRPIAGGGTEGRVAVTDVSRKPSAPAAPPLPLPAGSEVVSTVESIDGSRAAVQIVAESPLSIDGTIRWLTAGASKRGWSTDPTFAAAARRAGPGRAVYMTRVDQELMVTIEATARGGSIVVFNLISERG